MKATAIKKIRNRILNEKKKLGKLNVLIDGLELIIRNEVTIPECRAHIGECYSCSSTLDKTFVDNNNIEFSALRIQDYQHPRFYVELLSITFRDDGRSSWFIINNSQFSNLNTIQGGGRRIITESEYLVIREQFINKIGLGI